MRTCEARPAARADRGRAGELRARSGAGAAWGGRGRLAVPWWGGAGSRFRGKGGAEPRPAPEAAAGGAGRGRPGPAGPGELGEPFWGAGPERGRTWGRWAPPGAVTSGHGAGPAGGFRRGHRPARAPSPSVLRGHAMSSSAPHDGQICLQRAVFLEGRLVCVLAGE